MSSILLYYHLNASFNDDRLLLCFTIQKVLSFIKHDFTNLEDQVIVQSYPQNGKSLAIVYIYPVLGLVY